MIDAALRYLERITLEEMCDVKLMNRIDSKYLTTLPVLLQLLRGAKDDFFVQETDTGFRNAPYSTCYFDTQDVRMYYDHQRGKKSRRKIRIREYVDSGILPFLEIKDKNNKGRTKKKRVSMEEGSSLYNYSDFISKHSEFSSPELLPKVENRFNRITLVNKEKSERITIDTSLEFHNFVTGGHITLPNLVIIEWKRDGQSSQSRLKPLLRSLRIQECGFSKYIIGMAMTDKDLPQNRIKKRVRFIEKLIY